MDHFHLQPGSFNVSFHNHCNPNPTKQFVLTWVLRSNIVGHIRPAARREQNIVGLGLISSVREHDIVAIWLVDALGSRVVLKMIRKEVNYTKE